MVVAASVCGFALVWGKERARGALAPLAIGLAYFAGHLFIAGWVRIPPSDTTNWLPYFALASALLGASCAMLPASRWARGLIFGLVCAGALALLLKPKFQYAWSPGEGCPLGGGPGRRSGFNRGDSGCVDPATGDSCRNAGPVSDYLRGDLWRPDAIGQHVAGAICCRPRRSCFRESGFQRPERCFGTGHRAPALTASRGAADQRIFLCRASGCRSPVAGLRSSLCADSNWRAKQATGIRS